MIGKCVEWGDGIGPINPGEYARHPNGTWYGETPNGHGCNLKDHQVTEHEDGTITVSPSILVSKGGRRDDKGNLIRDETFVELYHGFLERGVWRSV